MTDTPDASVPVHEHAHEHGPTQGIAADASVRRAVPNDAPAVGTVQSAVWRLAFDGVLPSDVVAMFEPLPFARAWRGSLESPPSPRHVLAVSCAGPQVVGYAALGPCEDPDAEPGDGEILTMGVHPEARGAGHGSRLLNAAVDLLRESGFTHVYAWVPTGDEVSRGFLEAAGLIPDGAYRDRVVLEADPAAGEDAEPDVLLREVRLGASLDTI